MPIVSTCPLCQVKVQIDEKFLGKKVRCGKCKEIFTVAGQTAGPTSIQAKPALTIPARPEPAAQLPAKTASPVQAGPPAEPPPAPPDLFPLESKEEVKKKRTGLFQANQPSKGLQIIGAVGGICAFAFGKVVGLPVLIVGFFAVLVGAPLHYVTSGRRRRMVPAGAIQAGHAMWMLLAFFLVTSGVVPLPANLPPPNFIDALEGCLFLGFAILLIFLPYLPVILLMTLYQLVVMGINLASIFQAGQSVDRILALIFHVCLRILAIALMVEAYFRKGEESQTQSGRTETKTSPGQEKIGSTRYPRTETVRPTVPAVWGMVGGGLYVLLGAVAFWMTIVAPHWADIANPMWEFAKMGFGLVLGIALLGGSVLLLFGTKRGYWITFLYAGAAVPLFTFFLIEELFVARVALAEKLVQARFHVGQLAQSEFPILATGFGFLIHATILLVLLSLPGVYHRIFGTSAQAKQAIPLLISATTIWGLLGGILGILLGGAGVIVWADLAGRLETHQFFQAISPNYILLAGGKTVLVTVLGLGLLGASVLLSFRSRGARLYCLIYVILALFIHIQWLLLEFLYAKPALKNILGEQRFNQQQDLATDIGTIIGAVGFSGHAVGLLIFLLLPSVRDFFKVPPGQEVESKDSSPEEPGPGKPIAKPGKLAAESLEPISQDAETQEFDGFPEPVGRSIKISKKVTTKSYTVWGAVAGAVLFLIGASIFLVVFLSYPQPNAQKALPPGAQKGNFKGEEFPWKKDEKKLWEKKEETKKKEIEKPFEKKEIFPKQEFPEPKRVPVAKGNNPPSPPGEPNAFGDPPGQPPKQLNDEYVVPPELIRDLPQWFHDRKADLPPALAKQLKPNTHQGFLAPDSPFWTKLEEKIRNKYFHKSDLILGRSGSIYVEDYPASGGLLIGFFAVKTGFVPYIQPIYLTRKGEVVGRAYGYPQDDAACLKAKSGYAVGGIYVHSGDLLGALALTYMKIEETGLKRSDWYQSEWVGADGGNAGVMGHQGSFIVGVHSKLLNHDYITPRGGMTTLGIITLRANVQTRVAPTITSANSTTFTVGTAGSFTVTTGAGTFPPNATLNLIGTLPGGVTFKDNGDGTATLSGTPAAGTDRTYTLTITASNGIPPTAVQTFTLRVN